MAATRQMRVDPQRALDAAAAILGAANLDRLWCLASLLSAEEALSDLATGEPSKVWPMLNLEKVRTFCEAILESKAMSYKTKQLSHTQLVTVLNHCNELLFDPSLFAALETAKVEGTTELAFLLFFARLGNVQIRYQDSRHNERAGRLFAALVGLPVRRPELIPADRRAQVADVLGRTEAALGSPLRKLWLCWLAILNHYLEACKQFSPRVRTRFDELSAKSGEAFTTKDIQGKLLPELLSHYPQEFAVALTRFPRRPSADRIEVIQPADVESFLALFGRTTKELRELRAARAEYAVGPIGGRLSPLERYPVVLLDDTWCVVPNLRFFTRNFPDIVHFRLQEVLGNDYNAVRGVLQEVYLRALLQEKLPHVQVIPERAYVRGKSEVKGPDLTVVEGDKLIVIESKARRILAETRFTMAPAVLYENLRDAFRAVEGLGQKISDLRRSLPEYGDVQAVIDRSGESTPVRVVVLGDEFIFMGEVARHLEQYDPDYPLKGFAEPYCVVGLDGFELAVEKAAAGGASLYELLLSHWRESAKIDHSTPAADLFGGLGRDPGVSFAESFLPEVDGRPA